MFCGDRVNTHVRSSTLFILKHLFIFCIIIIDTFCLLVFVVDFLCNSWAICVMCDSILCFMLSMKEKYMGNTFSSGGMLTISNLSVVCWGRCRNASTSVLMCPKVIVCVKNLNLVRLRDFISLLFNLSHYCGVWLKLP